MTDNRHALTIDEHHILETQVLPAAKRWARDYPAGHNLNRYGLDTIHFWGAEDDPDIAGRIAQIKREAAERRGGAGQP